MLVEIDLFEVIEDDQAKMFFETVELAKDIVPQLYEDISKDIEGTQNGLAGMIASHWSILAQNKSPWGERYADTIKIGYASGSGGKASIYTDDTNENHMFVNMMEDGVKGFDIKAKLLSGRKVKRSLITGKPYVIVPFRWRTTPKKNTGKKTASFSNTMVEDLYRMVKARVPIDSSTAEKFFPKQARHKTSIATGLTKYGSGQQSQYFTFRVVTPDSKGWIHPGKAATPVFPEVEKFANQLISDTMANLALAYVERFKKAMENG